MLFKIDVEGYESLVLDGMSETLGRSDDMVGIVELNQANLDQLGVDVDAYAESLRQRFCVSAFDANDTIVSLRQRALPEVFDARAIRTDLLLCSTRAVATSLDLPSY